MMLAGLISLIITLLVLAVVYYVVRLIGLPSPIDKIVQVIFILIGLLYVIHAFGVY